MEAPDPGKTVTTVRSKGMNGHIHDVPVSELTFRPSVYGVIIKEGKVLLSSQWDGWDFPGGGIELGENIDDALAREIKEETGLSAKRGRLLHVQDGFFTHPDQHHYHSILMYFTCEDVAGDLSTDGLTAEEKLYVREARWIPLEEIHTLKFYNQVDSLTLIRLAAEGRGI